jgi:ribonuclease D
MRDELETPTKAEIATLKPFTGLPLERIIVPATQEQASGAASDLVHCRFVGFDTESKPTFRKGEASTGPHVVQIASLERAYIFQLHRPECLEVVSRILESPGVIKVGFGLQSDQKRLHSKLGIKPKAILDLNTVFHRDGYRRQVGARAAVAILFKQRLQKSKSLSTSNWALPELRSSQLLYAANDAYAAIKVLWALKRPESELPILHL